jgi:hypothetical protein
MAHTIAINENGRISGFRLVTMQRDEFHEKPPVYPKGRKCACCNCNLSVYNGDKYCAQCQNLDVRARKMKETVS